MEPGLEQHPKCIYMNCVLGLLLWLCTGHCQHLETTADVQSAARGSMETLTCKSVATDESENSWLRSIQPPKFELLFQGNAKLAQGRFMIDEDWSSEKYNLVISNVSFEDAGTYICNANGIELVVFDKYPSTQHCSINLPSDGFLANNDLVELSCDVSYNDQSKLSPFLQWSLDGNVVTSSDVRIGSDVTRSSVKILAAQLTQSSLIECRVRYRNNYADSNLRWRTGVNIPILRDTAAYTEVSCTRQLEKCSFQNNTKCTYTWRDKSQSPVSNNEQLDLRGLPEGNYSCVATCHIRNQHMVFLAQRISLTCNETFANTFDRQHSQDSGKSSPVILSVLIPIIIVLSIIVLVSFVFYRLFRKRFNHETETQVTCTLHVFSEDDRHTKNDLTADQLSC